MSSTAFGCDFTVVERIRRDVSFIVEQPINPEGIVVRVVPRISLAVQNKLHNSGTDVGVEERWLMEIESKMFKGKILLVDLGCWRQQKLEMLIGKAK